ncbi:hypothetical protein Tco_0797590 [Tanacetum coccineum]
MNPIVAQQVALDNALVAPENRIFPRLPNQEFVVPPTSDEEIVSFIKELGYTGDIDSVTKVYTDHMHQPWRTFVVFIKRCLYGKTIGMTNRKMLNSTACKTYLAFATGATTSKKARKFKRHASPSKKKTLVVVEEPAEKLAKKPAARRQSAGEAQMKKSIKRSKRETDIHQASGSSEGAGLEPKVPNEQKGKSIDTSKGTGLILGVPDVSKADSSENADLNKTDDEEEDEFVHTPDDYVPTNDENIDDEEYDRINKEMYSDVNVELKDTKLEGEGKDDKEMTDAGHVDAEHENVNQEVAGDQVKDVDQATVTAAPATQKTEVPLPSSSISFDYATKFLNFDNIPLAETEIISMMDIKVQHEDLKETISTTTALDSSTLTTIHQRLSDLENKVKTLRNVDHSSTIRAAIKSEVSTVVKEYIGKSLDDTLHKSILEDEDAMDKGVADRLKKRKLDDADKYEGPPARPETSKGTTLSQPKSTGKSAQAEETVFEAGDTQVPWDLRENIGNTDEPHVVKDDLKDWFKKLERPPTSDPEWNECKTVDSKPT